MKKSILAVFAAALTLCPALGSQAQTNGNETVTVLRINKTDGSTVRFRLPSKPELSFSDEMLIVSSREIEPVEMARKEVAQIDFEKSDISVGIADIKAGDFIFSYVGDIVQIASPLLESAAVFNISGQKMMARTSTDGVIRFDVSGLRPGIYIVAPDCHPAIRIVRK